MTQKLTPPEAAHEIKHIDAAVKRLIRRFPVAYGGYDQRELCSRDWERMRRRIERNLRRQQ